MSLAIIVGCLAFVECLVVQPTPPIHCILLVGKNQIGGTLSQVANCPIRDSPGFLTYVPENLLCPGIALI